MQSDREETPLIMMIMIEIPLTKRMANKFYICRIGWLLPIKTGVSCRLAIPCRL